MNFLKKQIFLPERVPKWVGEPVQSLVSYQTHLLLEGFSKSKWGREPDKTSPYRNIFEHTAVSMQKCSGHVLQMGKEMQIQMQMEGNVNANLPMGSLSCKRGGVQFGLD